MPIKEVIVFAGTINSPILLTISEIGPEEKPEKHIIEIIHNSTVGNNLQDHVGFGNIYIPLSKYKSSRK